MDGLIDGKRSWVFQDRQVCCLDKVSHGFGRVNTELWSCCPFTYNRQHREDTPLDFL